MNAIVETREAQKNYPVLLQHVDGDMVVLFSRPSVGTVVLNDDPNDQGQVGDHDDDFNMSDFRPFNDTVKLSN